MYYGKRCFFLFFIIFAICIGLTLFFENHSMKLSFSVFAMDNSIFTASLPIKTNFQDQQKSHEIHNKSSNLAQQLEEVDTCQPKPTILETDQRIPKSINPDTEPPPPIRIKVPTITNTGSTLLIEGTGFIPSEQVRVELSVDWISSSHELKDKTFYQCKMVVTNSSGCFVTTLSLPEMPFYTKGTGKYSIIGMESKQEKTALGSFSTSNIGFSFRQ